jgi:hypothetical protein
MAVEGYWKWELERRLAVKRWYYEDADAAAEDAWIQSERAPVLEARRLQLARREREAALMKSGSVGPELVRERVERIEREDAEWQAFTVGWEGEDQVRTLRREQIEGRRCAEIERWLDENSWELVNLEMDRPHQRRLLQ